MSMNTPNKLTIARIIATPVFMATLLIEFPYHFTVSMFLFIAASLTDMIDGKMARKHDLITDFGKFLDPLADKMLTTAAFLGFIAMGGVCWQITWIVFIVLFREFLISSLRLVTVSSGGKVVAANIWGKLKTVTQMVGIILVLFAYVVMEDFGINNDILTTAFYVLNSIVLWISAVLCVISGAIYLVACKEYIDPSK